MSGKGVPASDIDFVHAGPHMSWAKSTWEGSAGGIKGMWPATEFKENEWHRFVTRTWAPVEDAPTHSYVGVWMKDLKTGVWNHLTTTRYPGVIVNLSHFFGFQENFGGGNADPVAHLNISNTYSEHNGKWVADNKCQLRPQGEDKDGKHKERERLKVIDGGKALSLETAWLDVKSATEALKKNAEFIPETQNITYNQPAQPTFFDDVKISAMGAVCTGSQLLVKWDFTPTSCPQVGYKIEVFANAEHTGEPVKVVTGNDPELRSLLIDATFKAMPYVRLTITDVYDRQSTPVGHVATTLKPSEAKPVSGLVSGLNYHYYEAPGKTSWASLPDFEKLKAVREGAVSEPDISPRLKRTNYAFDFEGQIMVETPGIYEFKVVFASGLKLLIDGQIVIDANGYHSIGNASGCIPLTTGKHAFELQYVQGDKQTQQADDFLQILWSVPGASNKTVRIPTKAFSRKPEMGEPVIVFTPPPAGSGNRVKLSAEVSKLSGAPDGIQYFIADPGFDYFRAQGAQGGDYFLGETKGAPAPKDLMLWGAPEKTIRARLLYGKNRTIDSEPVTFKTAASETGPWTLTELEHHQYPVAVQVEANSVAMVGESMGLLTRSMTGDCTLVARISDITSPTAAPDGTAPEAHVWQAGIILRKTLDPTPGEPLGGKLDYSSVLSCADGSIRYCDSTMINGAGNQPSGDVGSSKKWMKIQRSGDDFIDSVSEDGKTWTVVKTVKLPKMGPTVNAGFFIYALPAATPLLHHAAFDNISLTAGGEPKAAAGN